MKSILLYGVLIYLGVGLFLYISQRGFIYFPVGSTGNNLDGQQFENEGHTILASVLNPGKPKAILYFGGNAENVDFNAATFTHLFNDYTIYLVKYRGYGGSSGSPTEAGIYSDALHIYQTISTQHSGVSVIGRSLGSAVATYLASLKEVDKLVLITPFDSVQGVAQSQFPIYPMSLLLKDKHDSIGRVKEIKADTLVIAAENDRVINMSHTQRLVDGFEREIHFKVIAGKGHNDIDNSPMYLSVLGEFMSFQNVQKTDH